MLLAPGTEHRPSKCFAAFYIGALGTIQYLLAHERDPPWKRPPGLRPARVRIDNGPELAAEALVEWCAAQRIGLGYIQPGKPDQNAFIERFNRTFPEDDSAACGVRLSISHMLKAPRHERRFRDEP